MNYGRSYNDYKDELELALVQNCGVECELYSIIVSVLRESDCGRCVSIRDVSTRRTTNNSSYLKGESGFPDFVVLKREKIRKAKILGCIEIKRPDVKLEQTDQINGHIISYKKMIYTNGLVWKFFELGKDPEEICLGSYINNTTIQWNSNEKWFKLLNKIDSFEW